MRCGNRLDRACERQIRPERQVCGAIPPVLPRAGGFGRFGHRFERDGIWRGDRTGYDPSVYPSFQPNDIAPAIGAALESAGVTWLHGRLTYRRVYNTGATNVSQFANAIRPPVTYEGSRISQERVGYSVDGTLPSLGGVKAGFAYDLYVKQMAAYRALLRLIYPGRSVRCFLLWTVGPTLSELEPSLLDAAAPVSASA